MKYKDFRKKLLKNLEFKKEYESFDIKLWFEEIKIRTQIRIKGKIKDN